MPLSRCRLLLMALALLCGLAGGAAAQLPDPLATAIEQRLAATAELDMAAGRPLQADLLALQQFYAARTFAPAWAGSPEALARGRVLAQALAAAAADGLDPANYGVARITSLAAGTAPAGLAERDFLLSLALVRYAQDIHAGRIDPATIDAEHQVVAKQVLPLPVLEAAAAAPDLAAYLATLPPQTPNYARLKALLAQLRQEAAAGGWATVPAGPEPALGKAGPNVAALRHRLVETGDLLPAAAMGDVFDAPLAAALRQFQLRHGLDVDGRLGKRTLAALNVPVGQRIAQAIVNLERRRWLPDEPGRRYLLVNLADFELKVVEDERTVFTSRVVVGDLFHQTPIFSRPMTYLVLNPTWNVPPSIAVKEILPKIRQDPGWLARNDYRLLAGWTADAATVDPRHVDWKSVGPRRFPYKIQQMSGPRNALGRVKFMLPNPYDIYLHDTPAKSYFERSVRAFSHGCVRVADPWGLARLLLGPQGWDQARIDAAVKAGKEQIVRLARPLPVDITYLTAWVNKDGTINYRDDVYGRDAKLQALLGQAG
jgi:murein L,D-transpeptidase YcbB/YkuD